VPSYLAAPTFARTGVVAGFLLDQGSGLTPTISLGVLFAQGTMYHPAPPPDEYNVTGASWTNTQYAVTDAQWFPGIGVSLAPALVELLGLPETTPQTSGSAPNIQLPAIIYTIGHHTIEIGQTVAIAGIVQAGKNGQNIQGYNQTGVVISINATQVAVLYTGPNPGVWENPNFSYPSPTHPLGAGNVPTLAAGVATVLIGSNSILPQTLAEVGGINPSGYDQGVVFVFGTTETAILFSICYPPSNASPYPGPGTYVPPTGDQSPGWVEVEQTGPTLPAAPASAQSWLFYNSTSGFYWAASKTPTTAGDAFLGWVVTNATQVIAWSSSILGSGPEAIEFPYPLSALAIGAEGVDVAPAFGLSAAGAFGYGTYAYAPPGVLVIGPVSLATTPTADTLYGTLTLYYCDEVNYPATVTLSAALSPTGVLMNPTGTPALTAPGYVLIDAEIIQLAATEQDMVLQGNASYAHSVTVGSKTYSCVEGTLTAAQIAANIVAQINAGDPNCTAAEGGASGQGVVCALQAGVSGSVAVSSSDGTVAATLELSTPASAIARGVLGSTIPTNRSGQQQPHSSGAPVWQLQTLVQVLSFTEGFFLTGALFSQTIPFRCNAVAAATLFVSNGAGNSPTTTNCYTGFTGGRMRAFSGGQILFTVPGVLAIQSNAAPPAQIPQASSIRAIYAYQPTGSVAASGASIVAQVLLAGTVLATLTLNETNGAGQRWSGTVDGSVLGVIPAETDVTINITAVGTTTPGTGLSVVVQL
jgi:hypothetical protein